MNMKTKDPWAYAQKFTRAEIHAEAKRRGCTYVSLGKIHADESYSDVQFSRKPRFGFKPLSMIAQ